ncbi:MAG: AbiH family protein [Acutalibacteraceae bacterium]|nr:AbiH family protein [Acutalibacteraceae bacterium]
MKILVLGNGFDLDHNLPTSYIDFLNFCNYVLDMNKPELLEKLKPTQKEYIKILKNSEDIKNTFLAFLKNNYLLKYFNSKIKLHGENWIDFEREIQSIVNEFKVLEFEFEQSNQYRYNIEPNHKIHKILKNLGMDYIDSESWSELDLSLVHKDLCRSLNDFSHALEYYISVFINNTYVEGVSPDIIDFDANKVLTFNYSNTYEKVYAGVRWNESIDHIHGVAIDDPYNESSIILGITTYEKDLQNYYVEFEKYFQRITKKTGNEYKKWLQQVKDTHEKMEVMFFGHSLDATDSDIIKELIYYDNSVLKIYYFNEQSYQQIVANLIEIIGKDSLIDFVSRINPKIEFIKQRKHCVDNTAGIEITRDIRMLYKLHTLSNKAIEKLLCKLKIKIEAKDRSYFYSQRKTISLYDVLKYYGLELTTQDDFLAICEKLDFKRNKNGKVYFYEKEEWEHIIIWGDDEIPCDEETAQLISKINKSNKKRFQEDESSKILTLKSSEEIKDVLIHLFEEENPDDTYWEQLEELFNLMYKNELFENALKLIKPETLTLPIRAKFIHFKNAYYEHCFYTDYTKQMEEAEQYEENI